jgi:hypothetical protein
LKTIQFYLPNERGQEISKEKEKKEREEGK